MKRIVDVIAYRRLRAPADDGGVLFDPPWGEEAGCLERNLILRDRADGEVAGRRWSDLRSAARRALLDRARRYTSRYCDPPDQELSLDAPLILAGHQPHLVHPGVWFKNFVLSELARRHAARAVHLLIDNDAVHSTYIRVPGGSLDAPTLVSIPMDRPSAPIPFEERRVLDPSQFATFGARVLEILRPLIPHPLIESWWPSVVRAARGHGNLGRAVAEARHRLESRWGLATWELPLSEMCDDESFRWFAAELFTQAERFRDIHNAVAGRVPSRPSPAGAHASGSRSGPARGLDRDSLLAVERGGAPTAPGFCPFGRLDADLDRSAAPAGHVPGFSGGTRRSCVRHLEGAHRTGIRLRPRALVTTMFARLALSDLFLHGVGGAKYDQLTDAIVRRFFGLEPPEYLVATATFRLPAAQPPIHANDITRVEQQIRELIYHPELWVDRTDRTLPLIAEKRRWIATPPAHADGRMRHQQIQRVNAQLSESLSGRRRQLKRERVELQVIAAATIGVERARVRVLFVSGRRVTPTATGPVPTTHRSLSARFICWGIDADSRHCSDAVIWIVASRAAHGT